MRIKIVMNVVNKEVHANGVALLVMSETASPINGLKIMIYVPINIIFAKMNNLIPTNQYLCT